MNKRIILFSFAFLAAVFYVNAQSGFGIKAGLSYNSNGKLLDEAGTIIDNKGSGKAGYNLGIYDQFDFGPIYIRPELVYTKTTSEYLLNTGGTADYKIARLDMPVLVGLKLIGPLNIFAGPAFQYILENDFKGIKADNIKNDFTVGINIGVSIELGRLGLDARYERGLSSNEASWTKAGNIFTLDARPEQIIFSLSYQLSKKK